MARRWREVQIAEYTDLATEEELVAAIRTRPDFTRLHYSNYGLVNRENLRLSVRKADNSTSVFSLDDCLRIRESHTLTMPGNDRIVQYRWRWEEMGVPKATAIQIADPDHYFWSIDIRFLMRMSDPPQDCYVLDSEQAAIH